MRCANCLPGADECVGIPERLAVALRRAFLGERFRVQVPCGACGVSCCMATGALRNFVRGYAVESGKKLGWTPKATRRACWYLGLAVDNARHYVAAVFAARGASV